MGFGGGLRLQGRLWHGWGWGYFIPVVSVASEKTTRGYDHALNAMPTWLGPSLFNIGADYWPVLSSKMQTGILKFRAAFPSTPFPPEGMCSASAKKILFFAPDTVSVILELLAAALI
ncbi:hypothetical protein NC652_023007 [Populus alba x Populus x berolinensis]|nr:hypothetical protein NC652_023007 [Populus alba x Populus x berolinensis]